jgi:hypothetical protein
MSNSGTKHEHPGCCNFATLLLKHHCDNCATVLRLGNSVTIVQQCGRIVTNILKVCVCVRIGHSIGIVFAYYALGE